MIVQISIIIAIVLSVVNTILIFKQLINEFNSKPKLRIEVLHPDLYQWYFKIPSGLYIGLKTRSYGFLSYVSIRNNGLKETSLDSWFLDLKIYDNSFLKRHPISIPEPIIKVGKTDNVKILPVLGTRGLFHDGSTSIRPGNSISGVSYFFVSFYGDDYYSPMFKDNKILGKYVIIDGFGRKTETEILFNEIPLGKIKEMVPDIDKIVDSANLELIGY
jgi:hypothetical protein